MYVQNFRGTGTYGCAPVPLPLLVAARGRRTFVQDLRILPRTPRLVSAEFAPRHEVARDPVLVSSVLADVVGVHDVQTACVLVHHDRGMG